MKAPDAGPNSAAGSPHGDCSAKLLNPATVVRLISQLTEEETDELLRYAPPPAQPDFDSILAYLSRASGWLIEWQARKAAKQ